MNKFFLQIVSIRAKKLSHTKLVASRYFKKEKGSLPVNVRRLKTSLLKLQEIVNSLSFFLSNSRATLIRKIKRPALQLTGYSNAGFQVEVRLTITLQFCLISLVQTVEYKNSRIFRLRGSTYTQWFFVYLSWSNLNLEILVFEERGKP